MPLVKSPRRGVYGDFQTPPELADEVCGFLAQRGLQPRTIIEPTCGRGNLLWAAARQFPGAERVVGVEIDPHYVAEAKSRRPDKATGRRIEVRQGDFFTYDWRPLLREAAEPLLVLGNFPWVTNAEQGRYGASNLPAKSNEARLAGIEALTGKSNFDVSEWMLLRVLEWFSDRRGTLAMLCKTTVARKVLRHAWRRDLPLARAELIAIDAERWFGAAVAACLLCCEFAANVGAKTASVYPSWSAPQAASEVGWREGEVVADVQAHDRWSPLLGADAPGGRLRWRSGVKHDCATVMELRREGDCFWNRSGEPVAIEPACVFPLLKGSDLARGRNTRPTRWLIVPQRRLQADTASLRRRAPRTWQYLDAHAAALAARKSAIYRGRPRFAVFGIGDYTFAPHKVAISGFHARFDFQVVGRHGQRPIVFDDTVYFVPCRSRAAARLLQELLHSAPAQEYLAAFLFRDAKRPITAALLQRLDLRKLARYLGRDEAWRTLLGV